MSDELFMLDSSKTDGSAETVMDYVLSYTLRSVNNSRYPIFSKYARKILFKLIEIDDIGQRIERVEVWKQRGEGHKKMDLTVEIDISQNSEIIHHALLIEDKYYSGIRYDDKLNEYQIETYKRIFDKHYGCSPVISHYWVISCISREDDKFDRLYGFVGEYNFKALSIHDLTDGIDSECESEIFNQFFLSDWC